MSPDAAASSEESPALGSTRPRRTVTIRNGTSRGRSTVNLSGRAFAVATDGAARDESDETPTPTGCPCSSGY
ncbi:MAG: hypothetical protein ACFCVF_05995 [Kineosporiaceae bacterium]